MTHRPAGRPRFVSGKAPPTDLARTMARPPAAAPETDGEPAQLVPLDAGPVLFGRHLSCRVRLRDERVAERHATVSPWPDGFAVHDEGSGIGTFVNGRPVAWAGLAPGDLVQIGPYRFQFCRTHLVWLPDASALTLAAINLRHAIGRAVLLDDVSLMARPGEFVGLLGPSGAGKTTLLNALSGLAPAASGKTLINGLSLGDAPDRWRSLVGYVPQEDIVHVELTPRQAFGYAARLRLPASTSATAQRNEVMRTLSLLDLDERADVPIRQLSGGQRKRVSVGVELLGRPKLLFLDEPTSGLDPATEAKLMRTLRELAHQGRTILCTTHIMENVELFDRIAVMVPGGKLAYYGPPGDAQEHFAVERFSQIYDRLEEQAPDVWRQTFETTPHAWRLRQDLASERQAKPFHVADLPSPAEPPAGFPPTGILMRRFARTLLADRKTLALLAIQPTAVGGLVAAAFADAGPLTFLLVIATLWFGCSLGAQQIVKERAILRRERRVNLDWLPYVTSKVVVLYALTLIQALTMWGIIGAFRDLPGELGWQLASLSLAALNGVAFGLIVSAFASSADSATGAVPLALIPQIVLAGLLLLLPDMNRFTRGFAEVVPSRWSYGIMEAARLEGRRIDADLLRDANATYAATNLYPDYDFKSAEGRKRFLDEHVDQTVSQAPFVRRALAMLALLALVQFVTLLGALALRE